MRILRLVQKWLRASVLEDGIVTIEEKGTGQGSVISPLLANVYLHYVFDLWAERWRRREATGDMIMVRYGRRPRVGFQHENDARCFWDPPDRVRPPCGAELQEARTRQAGDLYSGARPIGSTHGPVTRLHSRTPHKSAHRPGSFVS
jgi:RNA-directed DNA polymerase